MADISDYEIEPGCYVGTCKSVDNSRLFVGGIPTDKNREEIMAEISSYTDGVSKVILCNTLEKSEDGAFAFVEYETHRAAALARRNLLKSKIKLFDHDIAVEWAQPAAQVDEEYMDWEDDVNPSALPHDVLIEIFSFLDFKDRCRAGGVCKSWHGAAKDPFFWRDVVQENMSVQQILKLLERLPDSVTHLHLKSEELRDMSSYLRRHSKGDSSPPLLLFPEVMRKLSCKCPSLKSLVMEGIHFETSTPCYNRRSERVLEKDNRIITNNDDHSKCCELMYWARHEIDLPNIELLSLRSVFLNYGKNSRGLKPFVFKKLKVLELGVLEQFNTDGCMEDNTIDSNNIATLCSFRNLEELYIRVDFEFSESGMFLSDIGFEIMCLLQTAKKLRILSYQGCARADKVLTACERYGNSLEELCLSNSRGKIIRITDDSEHCLEKMHSLCLRRNFLLPNVLHIILRKYPSLKYIDVSHAYPSGQLMINNISEDLKQKIILGNNGPTCCDHFKMNGHYHS